MPRACVDCNVHTHPKHTPAKLCYMYVEVSALIDLMTLLGGLNDHCCVWFTPTIVVDCGLLDHPQRGRVFLSGTTFGSRANYSCETNHKLVGPVRRVCEEDGVWSNTPPSCEGTYICIVLSLHVMHYWALSLLLAYIIIYIIIMYVKSECLCTVSKLTSYESI